jgi:hypothetical protein
MSQTAIRNDENLALLSDSRVVDIELYKQGHLITW